MLYPTITELTKDEFNRYELALATAKCARIITDEYVQQREAAEKAATGNKETDKNLIKMINKEYRDERLLRTLFPASIPSSTRSFAKRKRSRKLLTKLLKLSNNKTQK